MNRIILSVAKGKRSFTNSTKSPISWRPLVAIGIGTVSISFAWMKKDHLLPFIIKSEPKVSHDHRCSHIDQNNSTIIQQPSLFLGLWKHLKHELPLLSVVVILTGLLSVINIFTPILIGRLITIVQAMITSSAINFSQLNSSASQLFLVFAIQGFLTFLDIAAVSKLGENFATRLRLELYSSILSQDISFFDARLHGEIVGRLSQDIQDFKHTFKLILTQGVFIV
jgi:ABC-type bacteriocin/lantibiotic exporter with double-glycine peptidase domain